MGAGEDYWAQRRTFSAFLCLSDAARRSASSVFRVTTAGRRGEGMETVGLGGVEGLIRTDGKRGGKKN